MPPPNVQTVLADPNFHSLAPSEKQKVLLRIDPNYAALPPQEQAKALDVIQYGPQESTPGGFWRGAYDEAKGLVEGAVKSTIPSRENLYGLTGPTGPLASMQTVVNTVSNWERRKKEGRSVPYRLLTGATEAVGLPTGAEGEEEAAARGDAAGVLGHAAVPAALAAGGYAAGEVARNPAVRERMPWSETSRIRTGTEKVGGALKVPTSEEAVAAASGKSLNLGMDEARDLATARDDLAKIERENPVKVKGAAGTFARAKNVFDYSTRLWKEAHEAPIKRHQWMSMDKDTLGYDGGESLVNAGNAVLTPEALEADPAGGRAAQRWLKGISRPRTLASEDQLLREINNDVQSPKAEERYGNLMLRAKSAVARQIRTDIDTGLERAGEKGIRDTNRRWAALQTVGSRMIKEGLAEAQKAGRAGPVPDWLHSYVFLHPSLEGIYGSVGAGVNAYRMFQTAPSKMLARGMTMLAGTSLEPPPTFTPEYVGKQPAGLLPAPGETYTDVGKQAPGGPAMKPPPRVGYETPSQTFPLARRVDLGKQAPGGPRTELPPRPGYAAANPADRGEALARIPGREYRSPTEPIRTPPAGYSTGSTPDVTSAPVPEVEAHMASLLRAGRISRGEIMRMVRIGVLGQGAATRIFKAARQ